MVIIDPINCQPTVIIKASWYGRKFQGHKTANGEKYNFCAHTAAYNFLPFGTFINVTNLRTHKSIIVRINDHTARHNKCLDLSYEAARRINMTGVDYVEYHVVAYPTVHHPHSIGDALELQ